MEQSDEESEVAPKRKEYWDEMSTNNRELLIEEYKELSEEVRYRDGLMHNSYYLLAIAMVFFLGNIISWTNGDVRRAINHFPEFIALFGSVSGLLLVFVGIVMRTYNKKRVAAEKRRRDVEEALNRQKLNRTSNPPPFGIQREVLRAKLDWEDDPESDPNILFQVATRFMDSVIGGSIGTYCIIFVLFGGVLFLISIISAACVIYTTVF